MLDVYASDVVASDQAVVALAIRPSGRFLSIMLGDGGLRAELQARLGVLRRMTIDFHFTPELHLKDGRIIRDLDDALGFAREQEARPGVDQRDEILHKIEHAQSKEEAHAAAHSFVRWLEQLEILQ